MGLELSIVRLNAMKKDVFGLGTMQFLLTSAAGKSLHCTALHCTLTPALQLSQCNRIEANDKYLS